MEGTKLTGRRILVVEDEMMVAMLIEDMLTDMGCQIVGPAARIDDALSMAEHGQIDAAVLDVNLNGRDTFAVADLLRGRGIPFVFATGYGAEGVAERLRDEPTLQKPFRDEELAALLVRILEARPQ